MRKFLLSISLFVAAASPAAAAQWQPVAGIDFAIILSVAPKHIDTNAPVVDIDLFDTRDLREGCGRNRAGCREDQAVTPVSAVHQIVRIERAIHLGSNVIVVTVKPFAVAIERDEVGRAEYVLGLGDASGPVTVRIIRPDGRVEEKNNVAIDRYTTIR